MVRVTLVVARISSSKDWRACEISGLIEATVRERSSVLYRCFTSFGRSGCTSRNQVSTIKFSKVGVNSSSSVKSAPWCCMLLL